LQAINCNHKVITIFADSSITNYYMGHRKRFHFSTVDRYTQCS
jgi:hypothetical protein